MSIELLTRRVLRLERQIQMASLVQTYWRAINGSTSIASGGTSILVYSTEVSDNRESYDPTTGIFTCPAGHAGVYAVHACLLLVSAAYTNRELHMLHNGTHIYSAINQSTVAGFDSQHCSGLLTLAAGDTVKMEGTQANGAAAARAMQADSRYNYFFGYRVA